MVIKEHFTSCHSFLFYFLNPKLVAPMNITLNDSREIFYEPKERFVSFCLAFARNWQFKGYEQYYIKRSIINIF